MTPEEIKEKMMEVPATFYRINNMSNPKTYILQKDLPDSKAGDEYIFVDNGYNVIAYYLNGLIEASYWTPDCVENNPEWFLPEEPPIYTKTQLIKYIADAYRQGKIELENGKYWEGSFPTYLKTLNL